MSYAITYYGHSRSFKQTHPTHQRSLLKRWKPDVFIHTWKEADSVLQSWYKKDSKYSQNINPSVLINTFKPKSYYIENYPYKESGIKVFGFQTDLSNVYNYLYTIYKSLELTVKCKEYNFILLTRMDLVHHFELSFRKSDDIISYPLKISFQNNRVVTNGSDLIVQLNHNHAVQIINNIKYILEKDLNQIILKNNLIKLEEVFCFICKPFNIKYQPFNYSIMRMNGDKLSNSIYYHSRINIIKCNKKSLFNL